MFNIKATPLNVIHCDYNHYVGEMLVQTEFDFKDGIAFSKETGKPVQILFRLTTRTHYQNKTILSYVTEQTFRFVPDTDGILFKHVDMILRESWGVSSPSNSFIWLLKSSIFFVCCYTINYPIAGCR